MDFVWEKSVIIFYKERVRERERKAFAVVKARKLEISEAKEDTKFIGRIQDSFPLMGDVSYISSKEGKSDRYVLCWFEDEEDDFSKAWKRLTEVTFPEGVSFVTDKKGKRTYNTGFKARRGKLK